MHAEQVVVRVVAHYLTNNCFVFIDSYSAGFDHLCVTALVIIFFYSLTTLLWNKALYMVIDERMSTTICVKYVRNAET
jgi:uncharacterized membrane protein